MKRSTWIEFKDSEGRWVALAGHIVDSCEAVASDRAYDCAEKRSLREKIGVALGDKQYWRRVSGLDQRWYSRNAIAVCVRPREA